MNAQRRPAGAGETAAGPVAAPLWLLSIVTFSGTMAMHIFVPALPLAAVDLGASAGSMQLTISFYILGLAVGQLFYGPLSDRYGRRPVLLAGLALYTVASLAAAVAPGAQSLIVIRLVQALGGCSGLVLGRAIVRDGATLAQAAKRLALMNLMTMLSPGLAPVIGELVGTALGWRAILYALFALGVLNLVCTWLFLPETSAVNAEHSVAGIARNYRSLLTSPAFLGYAVGGGCATTSMYAFISAAPFIFIAQLHRPVGEVGLYLGAVVFGVWMGSVLASRLAGRVPIAVLMVRSNLFSLIGAVVFLAAAVFGFLSVPLVVVSMFVFTFGVGIAGPAALAEAVSVNPRVIGSASGVYGFTQMTVGAICTALAGLGQDPALASALVLVVSGLLGQGAFWFAIRAKRAG